jgi:hypothetical protein
MAGRSRSTSPIASRITTNIRCNSWNLYLKYEPFLRVLVELFNAKRKANIKSFLVSVPTADHSRVRCPSTPFAGLKDSVMSRSYLGMVSARSQPAGGTPGSSNKKGGNKCKIGMTLWKLQFSQLSEAFSHFKIATVERAMNKKIMK